MRAEHPFSSVYACGRGGQQYRYEHRVVHGNQNERCFALALGHHVRTALDEPAQGARRSPQDGEHQDGSAGERGQGVGAGVQQGARAGARPFGERRHHERGDARIRTVREFCIVWRHTRRQQHRHDSGVGVSCRTHHHRAGLGHRTRVGAGVEQKAHGRRRTTAGGGVERGRALGVLGMEIRTLGQQGGWPGTRRRRPRGAGCAPWRHVRAGQGVRAAAS